MRCSYLPPEALLGVASPAIRSLDLLMRFRSRMQIVCFQIIPGHLPMLYIFNSHFPYDIFSIFTGQEAPRCSVPGLAQDSSNLAEPLACVLCRAVVLYHLSGRDLQCGCSRNQPRWLSRCTYGVFVCFWASILAKHTSQAY